MSKTDDAILGMSERDEERFFSYVDKRVFGCDTWTGATHHAHGRGQFSLTISPGETVTAAAPRVAFFIHNRYLPEWPQRAVCHSCGNGEDGCVDSGHLYDGDQSDNMNDAHSGRHITNEMVAEVYSLYLDDMLNQREVAEAMDMGTTMISNILRGDHKMSYMDDVRR